MQGFDSRWKDFPDYIIGITKEIWEDRRIETLEHYYTPDIIVRAPASLVIGNESVIAATMATLSEFPDRTLLGEDVIWSGTPEKGMMSAHRILTQATHSRSGIYGKASGKQLSYRVIAYCHAINNQINNEWLIRDQSSVVQQLGWDVQDYARTTIQEQGGAESCVRPYVPEMEPADVPLVDTGNDNQWGQQYADILQRIMQADMAVIPEQYDRACQLEYSGGISSHSHRGADAFWMGLRAAFPSATFRIEHQIGREDNNMPARAALRWSLHGKHDGWGMFGKPTGAPVYVMGMSQAEFGPWGLRREYSLIDETAIWKQILLHTGNL